MKNCSRTNRALNKRSKRANNNKTIKKKLVKLEKISTLASMNHQIFHRRISRRKQKNLRKHIRRENVGSITSNNLF